VETKKPLKFVPYHMQEEVNGVWCSICPECDKAIPMKRKDFESFKMTQEAFDHFNDNHSDKLV
jgi:hypothetical protein